MKGPNIWRRCGLVLVTALVVFSLALLAGCGGGANAAPPVASLKSIQISPASANIPQGTTQQFKAAGSFSDNSTKDLTNSVSWASSNTNAVTIDSAGLATGVGQGTASITASMSGITSTTPATVTVGPAVLVFIAVTPANKSVQQGSAPVQYTATGTLTDNTTQNLTTAVNWSSSNTAVATVSNTSGNQGLATIVGAGTTTITATDPGTTKAGSTSLTVTTSSSNNNSKLNGQYAFLFKGFNASGPQAIAGSFFADGNGSVTGGVEDINRGSGVTTNLPFSGTYSVGADNRGSMTLNSTQGTTIYQFTLNSFSAGVASRGRFIEDISSPSNGSGVLAKQNSADFTASKIINDYALGFTGDLAGSRIGLVGRFHADGAQAINSGNIDISTPSASFTNLAFTGSYSLLSASNGRGTVTLNVPVPGTSGVFHFSFYIVSANELFIASLDARSSTTPLLSGSVLQQSGGPFSKAALNGAGVLGVAGVPSAPPGSPCALASGGGPTSSVLVARMVADGGGNAPGAFDRNDCGEVSQNAAFTGTYDVAANGRGTFSFQTSTIGANPFVVYVISPNKAFFLEGLAGAGSSSEVRFGLLESQAAGPFNAASLSGTFGLGTDAPPANGIEDDSGAFTLDGNGNFTGNLIFGGAGAGSSGPVSGTYGVTSVGRGTLTLSSRTSALYVISPSKFLTLATVESGDTVPVLIIFEK